MDMPDVWKPLNGSVSFVLLRHQTRWGLKCSTLAMGSSTLMVSTKRSGCVAINANRLSICAVHQAGHFFVHSGEAKDNQKEGQKGKRRESNSSRKDCICRERPERAAVEGAGPLEHLISGRRTKICPPKERWSKNRISKETGIPYTTICERLSGRRGGGKRGKIAGGKCTAKVLKAGKFKRVTLTDFKRVMIRVGNRLLDHLCNPPLPLFLP